MHIFSQLHCHGLKFFLQISVSFWLVGSSSSSSSSSSSGAAAFLSHFRLQSGSALLPLGISARTAANFKRIEMIRSCFCHFKKQTTPSLLVTHFVSAF